jgi:hypothetical protein
MPIIVQEGEATVSLLGSVQAPDGSLRTNSLQTVARAVKVFYRDFEIVRVEARDGDLELLPGAIGAIAWARRDRRYQLKPTD